MYFFIFIIFFILICVLAFNGMMVRQDVETLICGSCSNYGKSNEPCGGECPKKCSQC